ncbi:MAG: hypothetical protein V7637_5512, partial [Mycobacteriales bacterium]
MSGTAQIRGRALQGGLLLAAAVSLAGCGVSAGTKTVQAPPATTPAGAPAAAPAGVNPPCQPGSGQRVTSPGPMNLTDMSGQQLGCAVFDHLTMNQVNMQASQLPGAAFQASTLNGVKFNGANLTGAVFTHSTLNFVDFTSA